jgi:hypothetical protein
LSLASDWFRLAMISQLEMQEGGAGSSRKTLSIFISLKVLFSGVPKVPQRDALDSLVESFTFLYPGIQFSGTSHFCSNLLFFYSRK